MERSMPTFVYPCPLPRASARDSNLGRARKRSTESAGRHRGAAATAALALAPIMRDAQRMSRSETPESGQIADRIYEQTFGPKCLPSPERREEQVAAHHCPGPRLTR